MLSLQMGQITWILTLRDWCFTVWGTHQKWPFSATIVTTTLCITSQNLLQPKLCIFDHLYPFPPPKTSNPTPPQPPISSLFKIYLLYLFALNVSVAPYTRNISCKQHTYRWVIFLIELSNLYLLVYLIQLHLLWLLIYLGLNLPITIVDFFCPICSTFLFSHLFALFCIKYYFVILFLPLLASQLDNIFFTIFVMVTIEIPHALLFC